MSNTPKFSSELVRAIARDNRDVTVLFPTPPFPDNITNLFLTSFNRSFTRAIDGSGPFATPELQIFEKRLNKQRKHLILELNL
uniref:CSON002881 protein n=1 Tax=Culicoides sonorensis TaxID=179676 RepID=A0A336L0B2_CULSO